MLCFDQISQRVQGLRGLAGLSQDMPEAKLDANKNVVFQVDFDAASADGYNLHFRAVCRYQGDKKQVDINRRVDLDEASDVDVVELNSP